MIFFCHTRSMGKTKKKLQNYILLITSLCSIFSSSNYRVLTQFANIIARYPHLMLLNAERFVHQLSLDNSWRSHMLQAIKRSPNIWINYDGQYDLI